MTNNFADLSYLQVYKGWMHGDQSRNNGESTIPINIILLKLIVREALTKSEYQVLNHETTDEEKNVKLFIEIMPPKGEAGFNHVIEILKENKYAGLAEELVQERDKCSTGVASAKVKNSLTNAQAHLSRLIKENLDFMAKYWTDVIRVARTYFAFVDVQISESFKTEVGPAVHQFREIFENDVKTTFKRILIQGDPGCGKTTYVNKIALDWAKGNDYLREKFEFVFLISLQTLTMSVQDTINAFLPEDSKIFFDSYAKSVESKILLILDSFDEFPESSVLFQSVMNILNGQTPEFQFYTFIITTRRSHVYKIPQQCRERSLLIKGFDEASMKLFLEKQHVPLPANNIASTLNVLLQTPLFCAIYCSLYPAEEEAAELEDTYDLIKALVENCVENSKRMKTVLEEEKQFEEIGKYAFKLVDSHTLIFLKDICKTEVPAPSFDLKSINLDLLIKRKVPAPGINRFKEEFAFPHQLIAEYLAARYFAR